VPFGSFERSFHASLSSFIELARAWDIKPILMTQFNRLQTTDQFVGAAYKASQQPLSYDEFVQLYKHANELIRRVAREKNEYLIDPERDAPPTRKFIYDAVYPNDAGSEFVAERVVTALRRKYPNLYR
jgi:hypothetical protein